MADHAGTTDRGDNEADISGIAPLPGDLAELNGSKVFTDNQSRGRNSFSHPPEGDIKSKSLPASPDVSDVAELATRCPASWSSDNLTMTTHAPVTAPPGASIHAELFAAPQTVAPLMESPVQPSPGRNPAINWESPESTQKPVAQHIWEDPTAAATFSQEKVRQRLDFGAANEGEFEPVRDTQSAQSVAASSASPALVRPVVMPQMPVSGCVSLDDSLAFSDADSLFSPIKQGLLGCHPGSDADEDSDCNKESCDPPPTAFKQPLLRPRRSQEPDDSEDEGKTEPVPDPNSGDSSQLESSGTASSNAQPPWFTAQKQMQDLQTSLRASLHATAENPRIEEMKQQLMMNLSAQMQAELAKLPASPAQQSHASPHTSHRKQQDDLPPSPMKKPHPSSTKHNHNEDISPMRSSQHSLNQDQLPTSPMKIPHRLTTISQNVTMSPLNPVYLQHTASPTKGPFKVPEVPSQYQKSSRKHIEAHLNQNSSNAENVTSDGKSDSSLQKVSLHDIEMTFPHGPMFPTGYPQNQQELLEQMMAAHQRELIKIQHEIQEQRQMSATMVPSEDHQDKTRGITVASDHQQMINSGKHVITNHSSKGQAGRNMQMKVHMQMSSTEVKDHGKSPPEAKNVSAKKQKSPGSRKSHMGPASGHHGNTANLAAASNQFHQSQPKPPAKNSGIPRPTHSTVTPSDRISPQRASPPRGLSECVPPAEEPRGSQWGHQLDSSVISSIHGDKRDTIGGYPGLNVDKGQSSSTPLNSRTQARTSAPAASIEIQSMEAVRNHLAKMMQMTNQALPSNSQFDETKEDASLSLLLSDLGKDSNLSLTSNLSNPGPQSLVDLNSQLEGLLHQGFGQTSVARQQPSSVLVAENHMLRETLEKERFRRKHLEKEIQQNQGKMLELQQQLAVAISTDRKKDAMIEQLDKTLAKVVDGWKQRETQKTELIEQLQQENDQLRTTQEHQQGLLLKFEKELASTVEILSQERTQSTQLAEHREKQLGELTEDRDHAYKLLDLERSRFAVVQEERDRLSTEKAKFQDQLLQKIQTLETERECWEEKENEYLQKIDEIMENHLEVVDQERNNAEKQLQLLDETQQALTSSQREEHDVRIKLDTATREKESLRVEMGLLEARMESSKRKLEADLRAESEKQITAKLEEAHERQVKSEEDIRERHRRQIVELNQQQSAEVEAQLQQYHEDLNRREQNFAKVNKDSTNKISSLKQELDQTRQQLKHVESQRMMTTQKVESMMKHYCNETLRLLQVTPAFNTSTADERGKPPVYTLSPIRPHHHLNPSAPGDEHGQPVKPPGFAVSLPVPNTKPATLVACDLSMPIFNVGLPPPSSDLSGHGVTQTSLLEDTLDVTQEEPKTFEEMFNAAIASTLANQSFTLRANQPLPYSQPANQGSDDNPTTLAEQSLAQDAGAMTTAVFETPTSQKSAFMRVQHAASQPNEDPPSFLFKTIRPAHQEQDQHHRTIPLQDLSSTQHVTARNPAPIKPTGFFDALAHDKAHENPSNAQFLLRERQDSSESDNESNADFNPMLEDLSIGTSHLDDTEWRPARASLTSAGQHQGDYQQSSPSHHQGSMLTDYSQMSCKFEEHESRQAELQRYVQMLLERSPGDASVSQDQDDSQVSLNPGNLLASVAESLFSPRRQPGPGVFSGQGQSQGQSQEDQQGRNHAFSKTVLLTQNTNAGAAASEAGEGLSPRQVREISRLLTHYHQGNSDSSRPPVHELVSYLRDLAPTHPEKTPPTSPGQSQVPQRGPSNDLAKVKRNLSSNFAPDTKQGQKQSNQSATKAGSPKQSRSVVHKISHKAKHVVVKAGHYNKVAEKKSASKKGPVWK